MGERRTVRNTRIILAGVAILALLQFGEPAESQTTPALTIGPGDVLEVSVLGVEELSRRVRVLGDGTITLPLLGNFRIGGISVRESEDLIAEMLLAKKLVNDPQVSIFVVESVSGAVSVQGAVQSPDSYDLVGGSTLLEIIGRAGGVTQDRGAKILVVRGSETQDQQTLEIDASRLLDEGDVTQNVSLKPGDIVVVPPARRLRVYVTGAVRSPGAVDYMSSEGITVLQAITAAGGPTERANLKKVTIKRRNTDGTEELLPVNAKRIQNGKDPDLPLERNDTVVVGEWLL
jgi:polysaccharide export outer membrane protein